MILTFVFDTRNAVRVDGNVTKKCVNINKGRGYNVVYPRNKIKCTMNTKTTYDVT